MAFNINEALTIFSDSLTNHTDALRKYCADCGYEGSAEELAKLMVSMQDSIFYIVRDQSMEKQLTFAQIEQIARDYLLRDHRKVDNTGLKAILRSVVTSAVHEGYIVIDPFVWSGGYAK